MNVLDRARNTWVGEVLNRHALMGKIAAEAEKIDIVPPIEHESSSGDLSLNIDLPSGSLHLESFIRKRPVLFGSGHSEIVRAGGSLSLPDGREYQLSEREADNLWKVAGPRSGKVADADIELGQFDATKWVLKNRDSIINAHGNCFEALDELLMTNGIRSVVQVMNKIAQDKLIGPDEKQIAIGHAFDVLNGIPDISETLKSIRVAMNYRFVEKDIDRWVRADSYPVRFLIVHRDQEDKNRSAVESCRDFISAAIKFPDAEYLHITWAYEVLKAKEVVHF